MRSGAAPLHRQVEHLRTAIQRNERAMTVLAAAESLALPGWYLGAGAVAQTVWNLRHGFGPADGIEDYDLVYFDPTDLDAGAERDVERRVAHLVADNGVVIEVKNQARVHLWYPERFGRRIEPFTSCEQAIATWPTTATSVGVRLGPDDFVVCSPFGLSDLLGMVVRPNRAIVSREVYESKVSRWVQRWPRLQVVRW